jgi:lipoprotein NlpD
VREVRLVGLLWLVGWGSILAEGCAGGAPRTAGTYIVQPRDTLYSIAWRHDLDYRDLARWNHIGGDFRITVGEVLILEPGGYHSSQPNPAGTGVAHATGSSASRPPAPEPPPPSRSPPPAVVSPAPGIARPGQPCGPDAQHWLWPTSHGSAPRSVPGGGILLLGTVGQAIRAACAGRVVYAGSGIRGYGNLIIIKHGDSVLSAYAHTVDLAVREGQEVGGGEEIAHMGTGPHDLAALYFEIRLSGKPVDPLSFLPGE